MSSAGQLANVVGIGLEGDAEDRDGLHAVLLRRFDDPLGHGALALFIDGDNLLDQRLRRIHLAARRGIGAGVFGEAGAAEAGACMQELRADAIVHADCPRHILHIAAGLLAEIGDLIDEGHLHRQERVGRDI